MRNYQNIWKLAVPYLEKGINKNFIIHTKGVIKATKLICKNEK